MYLKNLLFLPLVFVAANCFAQDDTGPEVTDVVKATFLNPGISYEKKTGKFQTLYGQAFMNTSAYYTYSSYYGSESNIYFDPALALQYRFYYNAVQRTKKGRRTEMNSLNYIAPVYEVVFSKRRVSEFYSDEKDRRAINTIGLAWGFQRNYRKRFSLDLYLGLGYQFSKATSYDNNGQPFTRTEGLLGSVAQINLGFWLNRKKEK
jgi:hypothetical protein